MREEVDLIKLSIKCDLAMISLCLLIHAFSNLLISIFHVASEDNKTVLHRIINNSALFFELNKECHERSNMLRKTRCAMIEK